jgi:WhiB family transcriptional regulator, redox-sensing transcriptional regulator
VALRTFELEALAAGIDLPERLADLYRWPSWWTEAACVDQSRHLFFPERGEPTAPAKAVCAGCPARAACLAWALEQGPTLHGVFGGTSMGEGRALASSSIAA